MAKQDGMLERLCWIDDIVVGPIVFVPIFIDHVIKYLTWFE